MEGPPVQVLNKKDGTIHIWTEGVNAICGWHSGTAALPSEFTVFYESLTSVVPTGRATPGMSMVYCEKCYSNRHLTRVPIEIRPQSMEEIMDEIDCSSVDSESPESSDGGDVLKEFRGPEVPRTTTPVKAAIPIVVEDADDSPLLDTSGSFLVGAACGTRSRGSTEMAIQTPPAGCEPWHQRNAKTAVAMSAKKKQVGKSTNGR
jgi:hypothetical protein